MLTSTTHVLDAIFKPKQEARVRDSDEDGFNIDCVKELP